MGDVVEFKKPGEPEREIMLFVCECGCRSFYINSDETIECCGCGDIGEGHWCETLPPVPAEPQPQPDNGHGITSFNSAKASQNSVLASIKSWQDNDSLMTISAFSKQCNGRHWMNLKNEETRTFVLARLEDLMQYVKDVPLDN